MLKEQNEEKMGQGKVYEKAIKDWPEDLLTFSKKKYRIGDI